MEGRETEIRLYKVVFDSDGITSDVEFVFEIEHCRHVINIPMEQYLGSGKLVAYRRAYHLAVEILLEKNSHHFNSCE